jgi:anti-anti-sigma regulatory factor
MLKITTQDVAGVVVLGLAGRLAGPWVRELELFWQSTVETQPIHPVRVDLSSVTFIDEAGKDLLEKMHRKGADLVAWGCMNRCIVEGIRRSEEKKG